MRNAANKIGNYRLDDLTMVVTLEPCGMCAGAIAQSRIKRLVFGAFDEKAGAVGSVWDLLRDTRSIYKPEVIGGVLKSECGSILRNFLKLYKEFTVQNFI
jgi:tRNA(adenine34) deaminase